MLERLATSKEVQVPNNHMADKEGHIKTIIAKILEAANEEPTPRLLAFDPTPAGLVDDRSLRRAFKNEWARIRARHFKEDGTACALCEVVEPEENLIEGHEVYSFPSPRSLGLSEFYSFAENAIMRFTERRETRQAVAVPGTSARSKNIIARSTAFRKKNWLLTIKE